MTKLGRPTDYNDSIIEELHKYADSCSREATELPTHEGFAIRINVSTDTIQEWKDKYEDFSVACKKMMNKQKNQLINDGLYGGKEVNQAMAIFLLKANHGMMETDRHLVETKGSLIDIDDDGKSNVHTVSPVPAQTN